MKSIFLSSIIMLLVSFNASADNNNNNKNLVFVSIGTQSYPEKGQKNYLVESTGETGTLEWTRNANDTLFSVNYLRQIEPNIYVGFSLGNNSSKSVLMGFGF